MDTVKIGRFLAELRHEKELTQEQLAERLGTSNKTISRWENGNYMPPVEMLMELSEFYRVSINELLSGKRLEPSEEHRAAEENLKEVLSVSAFSLEERKDFFTQKWKKDHVAARFLNIFVPLIIIVTGFVTDKILLVGIASLVSVTFNVVSYNKMMGYVERNAFDGKNNNDKKL